MQIKSSKLGIAIYIAPDAALIEETLPAFKAAVAENRNDGQIHLVIDLGLVNYIDSSCLEFISDLAMELRQNGGTLRLASPNPLCSDILTITRIDVLVPIYTDIESAGRSFI